MRARRLIVLALAIAAAFAAAAAGLPHTPAGLRALAGAGGSFSPLIALGAWVALTCALFPGTVLAAATGLAFGAALGGTIACAGATLGGVLAFLVARRAGRADAERMLGERFAGLRERLERRGFLAVLAARVAPGMPVTAMHYVCGLSRVRLRDFAAGILLGGAPRAFAYAAIGAGLSSGGGPDKLLLAAGGGFILATALAGAILARRARRRRGPAAARPRGPIGPALLALARRARPGRAAAGAAG